MISTPYPTNPADRNRWVLEHRGPKNLLDPLRPYAYLWEEEAGANGAQIPTATLFLTNKECPYRCLMCDLWQNTLNVTVAPGAIPAQIDYALARLPAARQIKIYNAGSFFDPKAIPPQEYEAVAERTSGMERVIVECHPAFIGERCLAFSRRIAGKLEVAVGLETAHPETLERLNKRITVDDFRRTAALLEKNDIALRVFLLLRPPYMSETEGLEWTCRSLDVSFEAGAEVCCVIPTRGGNGAMEILAAGGDFAPPTLPSLEKAVEYGLRLNKGRVFADLWDIEKLFACGCSPVRAKRLEAMNREQRIAEPVECDRCKDFRNGV